MSTPVRVFVCACAGVPTSLSINLNELLALRSDVALDGLPADPRSVVYFLLNGWELQVQRGKLISDEYLDQGSPPSRSLIRGINDGESQMMTIDRAIDWVFSSVVYPPNCLFTLAPSFSSVLPSTLHLQKMTWKSRQADVDTCRMKGKHKVVETVHSGHQTHSHFVYLSLFIPHQALWEAHHSTSHILRVSLCFCKSLCHTHCVSNDCGITIAVLTAAFKCIRICRGNLCGCLH